MGDFNCQECTITLKEYNNLPMPFKYANTECKKCKNKFVFYYSDYKGLVELFSEEDQEKTLKNYFKLYKLAEERI